jgi:hypothetical protein
MDMPARTSVSSIFSRVAHSRKPIYILGALIIIGIAVWAKGARVAASAPSPTQSAITPALQLAAGSLKLEGTDQAIDAASAAKLLPFWQLLDQLQTSSATAPQEISTVIDEIRLNMTDAQLASINAMSFTDAQLGSATRAGSVTASGTQAASAASGAMPGMGMFAGGGPMDGGPMPGGGSRSSSTGGASASSSAASPSLIEQVIELMEKKVQG